MQVKKGEKAIAAAMLIQRMWRGYVERKRVKRLLKRQKKKMFTVMELLQSERTYCDNLKFVVEQVMRPSKQFILDPEMHSCLFGNIEDILTLHSNFLSSFDTVMKDFHPHKTRLSTVLLAQLFNLPEFKKIYTHYCFNYKTTDQTIKFLVDNNPKFSDHLRKISVTSLESSMIKPVQRLCKYGLMINEYLRSMEPEHCDYGDIEKTALLIDKLVHETNDQVEEFLMRERLHQLRCIYSSFFGKISSPKKLRMYYETKEITLLDVVREQEVNFRSMVLFDNSVVLIPRGQETPSFLNFIFVRELVNHKYYKQIVQLAEPQRYSYLQFKQEKDRKEFMRILNEKIKQQEQPEFNDYIKVSIQGTETRESFFSSYTVYIVNISDGARTSTIYPRFKDLLKVQELVTARGLKFDPPLLAKESIIATLKSKTIEKRKLTIQEFLQRVLNNCPPGDAKEVEQTLGLSQIGPAALLQRVSSQVEQVSVQLPNLQRVKVLIPIHQSKIRDLKLLISEQMGMQSSSQFQIFQIRNRNYGSRKLLYDDEPVKKIYDEQREAASSINPFRDSLDYLYTRHYYLPREQEEEMYKTDQARAQLELSVIHSEILNYRLEEEVMLTFMCLFAMYIHLPIQNSQKLSFFLKELAKKNYKVSEEEFKIYYAEVRRMVAGEDNLALALPLVIIKIVSNSYLYQCQQFEVEVHHKVFSQLKKMYPNLQEKVVLGLHPDVVYLLLPKDRTPLIKLSYSELSLLQTHPNAIVFELLHTQIPLNLKTAQAFEISKIFEIYKK